MKRVTPNGAKIKRLRLQLERGSGQKEMIHALSIGERKLRMIENENLAIDLPLLGRIAGYLGVSRDSIAYSIDAPKLVADEASKFTSVSLDFSQDRVIPRFERDIAYATMDAKKLVQDARQSQDITVAIEVSLDAETGAYVEEFTRLITPLTWSERDWLATESPADNIATQRRVRELLVLLKGNDVWLYQSHHLRRLPERFTEAPPEEPCEFRYRLALAFGPPGEYGEESIYIEIDNGQPWLLKGRDIKREAT